MDGKNHVVTIEGLSPLQQELAEQIWNLDTTEDVVEFFDSLPRRLKLEAYVVYTMILWAWMDQEPVGDCDQAREIIDRIRNLS